MRRRDFIRSLVFGAPAAAIARTGLLEAATPGPRSVAGAAGVLRSPGRKITPLKVEFDFDTGGLRRELQRLELAVPKIDRLARATAGLRRYSPAALTYRRAGLAARREAP